MEYKPSEIHALAEKLLAALRAERPNDRSELDRNFAIAITDMEKLSAWLWYAL